MTTLVYVNYEQHSTGGEKIDPDEEFSDRTDTITEFEVTSVTTYKETTPYYTSFVLPTDVVPATVWVVVVRYSDGDTFSHETGCGIITDVCLTEAEANARIDAVESKDHPDSHYWNGYFSRLESVNKFKHHVLV